ncbi:alpha/beta hydrolase [Actinocorallia sp. A-T 12471]|uniref:alpha/beta hydrolase n=1 Tax=Actinocorallia sp. A-T 12471 TaxID=3089813 RepID=UPI0029D1E757|nr:alpha/beta hydrolase [Actinocorallia sp. A-T 12471]MDX6741785.1 alpha/beta hydrolase [Actinocorallia sp. A-T 12471]
MTENLVSSVPVPRASDGDWEWRPSLQSRVLGGALRLTMRPLIHRAPSHPVPIRVARRALDRAAALLPTDRRVRVERVRDPHLRTGHVMRAEWIIPESADDSGAVLYLHGGGYILCSPQTHRPLTSRVALDTGLPVLAPHYRLAPEHPFPAALEDALAAYQWLLDRGHQKIVIMGDSAGGHLAAGLAGEITRTGLPEPVGIVLYSPWVDLLCELSVPHDKQVRDSFISPFAARRVGKLVAGLEIDPRLHLLTADWTALPPVLIQVGGDEVLRPEAEELARLLTAAGGRVDLQIWPGQIHVFQLLNRLLPDADEAMRQTATFITQALTTPDTQPDQGLTVVA